MAALSYNQQLDDKKKILQDCQHVLEGLDEFIEEHKRANMTGVKLGVKDIMGLRVLLVAITLALIIFIPRFVGPNMVRKIQLTFSPLVTPKKVLGCKLLQSDLRAPIVSTNTNLSRNAIQFCVSAGTLLWIAWSVLSGFL